MKKEEVIEQRSASVNRSIYPQMGRISEPISDINELYVIFALQE